MARVDQNVRWNCKKKICGDAFVSVVAVALLLDQNSPGAAKRVLMELRYQFPKMATGNVGTIYSKLRSENVVPMVEPLREFLRDRNMHVRVQARSPLKKFAALSANDERQESRPPGRRAKTLSEHTLPTTLLLVEALEDRCQRQEHQIEKMERALLPWPRAPCVSTPRPTLLPAQTV